MKKKELEELERGVMLRLSDRFRKIYLEQEEVPSLRATEVYAVASALGEVIENIEYPEHWRRLLRRKDCPKYMKEMGTINVTAYYPKLSLPDEEHWVTIEGGR
tara:strand:+ start:135 stop:443 length:309 start_codon:yes stop_codon:yes gene_type:complete